MSDQAEPGARVLEPGLTARVGQAVMRPFRELAARLRAAQWLIVAVAVIMATGGSTNAVLHFMAIAHAAEVEWTIDDFERMRKKIPVICDLKPSGKYLAVDLHRAGGIPQVMKVLLDAGRKAGRDVSSLVKALVSGAAFPASLQAEFKQRGIAACQAYATADIGFIAYETPGGEGLLVGDGLILEIVRPGTGDPVPEGEVGEIVVTVPDLTRDTQTRFAEAAT